MTAPASWLLWKWHKWRTGHHVFEWREYIDDVDYYWRCRRCTTCGARF